ncbi:ABC transporter permease subunit [Granulicella tundricola]|nr:ABC transporter permease subunit [Granulicella tundricola]
MVLAALGTIALMRYAPGYFTDAREMDAQYAGSARTELQLEQAQHGTFAQLTRELLGGWMHRDLGRSRHFDVPVTELMTPRLRVTGKLLFCGVAGGWLLALTLALPLSARRTASGEGAIAAPTALLLAMPVGALATGCLLADFGGPVLVLSTLIAVRDFKLIYRLLRQTWRSPHFLYARALGVSTPRIMRVHLLPRLTNELVALATMSFVLALSAIVPVEVIFDVPGLGQLAWSAAMNRDMPVLLAVTLLMAACIGVATMLAEPIQRAEAIPCA